MSIDYHTLQNTQWPAATFTPQTLRKNADGILESYGKTVPVDDNSGYVPSCTFRHVDGSGDDVYYVNEGTAALCKFRSMKNVPNAYGTTAGRGPSPAIWDNCPVLDYTLNPQLGTHYFTDFLDGIVVASTQSTAAAAALGTTSDWAAFTATNPTITTLTDNHQGVVRISTTDDNTDAMIAYPKTAHTAGMFKFIAGKKLWMEMRIAQNVVGDSEGTTFFGFAQQGLLSTGALLAANEGQMVDKDWVGFERIFGDGDMLDTRFNTESGGTSPSEVGGDVVLAVAGTFQKLGIYCDGATVYFYNNGSRLADSVALTAVDFPNAIELALYIGVQGAVGDATVYIDVDWARIAQEW